MNLNAAKTALTDAFKRPVRWRKRVLELAFFAAVLVAIDQWSARNLLASTQPAPVSVLPTLAGGMARLPAAQRPTLVYFFAPWCTVCHLSIGNLVNLVAQQPELDIQLVALDYRSLDEVRSFIAEQQLPFPVLLGNAATFREWQVSGYPTYYMVDKAGDIRARSMGYSTQLGLWVRAQL